MDRRYTAHRSHPWVPGKDVGDATMDPNSPKLNLPPPNSWLVGGFGPVLLKRL